MLTIKEMRDAIEKEAIDATEKLREAKYLRNEYAVGYWTCYIQDRERLLIVLGGFKD